MRPPKHSCSGSSWARKERLPNLASRPDDSRRRSMNIKVKKVLVRTVLVLFVIIVLVLGVRAVFNFTSGKKLQAYLERAKFEGVVMSLKELAPSCDGSDNAALLWKAAEVLF